MQYTHNEAVLLMKEVRREELCIIYRLFENDFCANYSVLLSLNGKSGTEDYYIPNFAGSRDFAEALFEKLYKNAVLPCEINEIFSDGFAEIL